MAANSGAAKRPVGRTKPRWGGPDHRRQLDDAVLIDAAKAGDEAAWTEIIRRYSTLVHRRARSVGLSSAQADDAAQATWLRLATSLDRIRDPSRLGGWLGSTARNEAVSLIRREWRLLPCDRIDDVEHDGPDQFGRLEASETSAVIRAAVDALTEPQRVIVECRFLKAQVAPYGQIASHLGIQQGSIGPTLGRAMQAMRRNPSVVRLHC